MCSEHCPCTAGFAKAKAEKELHSGCLTAPALLTRHFSAAASPQLRHVLEMVLSTDFKGNFSPQSSCALFSLYRSLSRHGLFRFLIFLYYQDPLLFVLHFSCPRFFYPFSTTAISVRTQKMWEISLATFSKNKLK